MTAALEWLAASGPVRLLRGSFVLYPLLNAFHIFSIGLLVSCALLMDLRVLGVGRALPLAAVIGHLRPLALGALAAAALSGLLLFSVQPLDYWANPAFRLKLLLLATALLNALLFGRLGGGPAGPAMALLSILLWLGVLAAGRFIGFMG